MSALPRLVGHEDTRRNLARAFRSGTLPRTLLLHGPHGVGKQRLALWLGQLLVCRRPTDEGPCHECRECRQALKIEHPDIHWHFPLPRPKGAGTPERLRAALEKARATALEERRAEPLRPTWDPEVRGIYVAAVHTIRQQASKKPSSGARQVFVIGDAEWLVPQEASQEAANALLKLLEEPPGGTTFVLTSSEPQQLLPTIRSRATSVHVGRLDDDVVASFLVEAGADPDQAALAARLADGAIGEALGYLGTDGGTGPLEAVRREALALMEAALEGSAAGAYTEAMSRPPARARTLAPLLTSLAGWLRDLAAVGTGAARVVTNVDEGDRLRRLAARTSPERVARAIDRVEEARWMAQGNVNPQLLVFGLVHELRDDLRA